MGKRNLMRKDAKHCMKELEKRIRADGDIGTILGIIEVGKDKWQVLQYSNLGTERGERATLEMANFTADAIKFAVDQGEAAKASKSSKDVAKSPEDLMAGAPNIEAVGGDDA